MSKFVFFLLIIFSLQAQAQFGFSLETFLSGQVSDPKSSYMNSGNGAKISNQGAVFELRPGFTYKKESLFEAVVRSRHIYEYQQIEVETPKESITISKGHSDLSDAYIVGNVTPDFFLTLGLQNYQWGPAESASPSNVFFHFSNEQRSFFYKEKGRVLARANWNYANDLLFVAIIEPVDNNEPHWMSGEEFSSQSAFRVEKQFANPVNSLSVLVGEAGSGGAYIGEYFNWSPAEGYGIYADFRHQQNDKSHGPQKDNLGFVEISNKNKSDESWKTYGVLGFRYESTFDFRQELIYNQAGYDEDQWDMVKEGLTEVSPYLLTNFQNFAKPGLELRSRAYGYTSIRKPDPFEIKDVSVALRWLYSLVQNSSVLQLAYEQNLNDSFVLSAESSIFAGDRDTEFTLLQSYQLSAGLRYSF